MGLKLDMAKAYDQMEWIFLLEILYGFGFNDKIFNLLKNAFHLFTTLSCWICPPFGNFHNSIGLRQRDPLSQRLIILGAEVLSHIFTKAEEIGSIQGVGVARNAPRISHLFFADDGFIYLFIYLQC